MTPTKWPALLASMSTPTRRELDLARLAARERRLGLVLEILNGRRAEYRGSTGSAPAGLRESIADFGEQLGEVRRRQAEQTRAPQEAPAPARPRRQTTGRSSAAATRRVAANAREHS